MSQTNNLLLALKKQLRAQGKTYADVAQLLDLSEASVKRLFASQSFTLQRLEQLCDWLQIEFSELMQQAQQQPQLTQLTLQQEQDIAADQLLLLVAVSVISGFSFQDLLSHYALTEPECVRKLAALDRLKIIDLLPGNRIRIGNAVYCSIFSGIFDCLRYTFHTVHLPCFSGHCKRNRSDSAVQIPHGFITFEVCILKCKSV